ncbi:8ce986d7-8153-4657-a229-9c8c8768cecf [Sclerotinia trifoliorum]|uniref:8ce986d7-8153-4657-a229-9c8c8768cecf n=1 Tax=Sclerotinia trifoliorum TaxID=28548 RepID=A0A8H2VNL4_9HELO|nr:8ce986d7-8153-4657-a229-9c8c8768cecf [Sclerotinia trifoliorum]
MNSLIEPPASPGFSLRVKVFPPDAAEENDRPIRCFRVITSPNITIREFCTEASRVHEINYGQPLAIKKCMDDELFDVTQNDMLGPLFPNMSTIRIIKAPNKPNIRDSLPPTSALRFNPISVLGQKRDRSPLNGNAEPFWNPQKRQRTAIDPDHPIPSREIESWTGGRLEGILEKSETTIPDSQRSAILDHEDEVNDIVPNLSNSSLNAQTAKVPKELVSPFQEPPPRIQGTPKNSAGAKNASYHIQRATNRGRSVSTTATSPLTGEPQLPPHNHSNSTQKRKSNTPNTRSPRNESDIYDDFGSDTEEPTIRQSKLKFKKDAQKGSSGVEPSAKSPSNNNSHPSKAFQSISTPNELPLTPKSKVREEALRKRKENEEAAKEARASAAKAAEERRRESEREAVAAKAERMRKERSEERKAEEGQKQAARKQKEVAALEAQKLRDEKEKLRKQIEEDDRLEEMKALEEAAKQSEEESRKSEALENSKRASGTTQESRKGTPINKRSTPAVILPRQSSTPHYPRGKKSSLKTSSSSGSIKSSSPGGPAPKDTSLEAQMPLPSKSPRRVSFDLNATTTPVKPPPRKTTSIDIPNRDTTPKLASSQTPAQSQTPIPLPKTFKRPDRSATPVRQQSSKPSAMNQPPLTAARTGSASRSATPKPVSLPAYRNISTEPKPLQKGSVTQEAKKAVTSAPSRSLSVKEKSKSPMKPAEVPLPPSSDSSDSESEEMVAIKEEPKRSNSPETLQVEESKVNEDLSDEDVEMGENQSSSRESRSPVVFHSNAPSGDERRSRANLNQTSRSVSSSSEDESSDEEQSEDDADGKQNDTEDKTEIKETQESSEDGDDSDNDDEDVELPDAPPQRLSPELPIHARRNMVSPIKTTNQPQGSFSSPAKRPTIKPSFNFGASLSSLNSQKGAMFKPKPLTNGQLAKSKLQLSSQMIKKEFSASESEEESDSDDSSDDDVPIPATSQIIHPSTQNNGFISTATKKIQDADSDSDSDSDSGSDAAAAAMEEARRSLMAEVHQSGMTASQNNLPQSSQISVNSGVGKGKGKGETGVLGKTNGSAKGSRTAGKEFAKKGKDRITNGYDFKNYGSFN